MFQEWNHVLDAVMVEGCDKKECRKGFGGDGTSVQVVR